MSTIANEFDLDAILNEFRGSGSPGPQAKAPADRSKRLVLKSVDDAIQEDNLEILNGSLGEAPPQAAPEPPRTEAEPEAPEPEFGEPVSVPPPPETSAEELTDDWEDMDYASAQAAGEAPPETARRGGKQKSKSERILAPLVGLLALIALRREQRARGAPAAAAPEGNEPDPKKALDLYTSQEVSLRLRALAATVLTLLMLYVSCAWSSFLPLGGVLGSSVRVASALLLLMELSVMLCGLDLFTGGLMGFAFGEIGTESLAAASCVLSVLDAMILAGTNNGAYGLPYCAVSAASMTGLLWGAYFNCRAGRGVCRVLSSGKSAYSVCSDTALSPGEITLFKLRRNVTGFIARSEEADLGESVYAALSPFLLIASVLLGLLSSLARGRAGSVVHCISVMSAVSATFSCAVCVALPLYIASRKLTRAGSALAGWSGLHDVGAARSIVITDEDLFPYGTVRIGSIRVVQNADADKVISYTGSVIAASGGALAPPFAELLRRNGYAVCRVESFTPKDGGGVTAAVRGESVSVGSSGFMNLMGIRIPRKLTARNAVYTAINGALVGIFEIDYEPVGQVQEALVLLSQSRLAPVFAVRDFNINPAMLRDYFELPTDGFRFPAYSERYTLSAPEGGAERRSAAVLGQDGMGALVEMTECARKAYQTARVSTAVSAAGSVLGLLLMFLLCWTGAFATASAGKAIVFMLLWLVPEIVLSIGFWRS